MRKPFGQRDFPRKDSGALLPAEPLIADIMVYLAGRPDDLTRFFQLSGVTPQSLRAATTTPGFVAGLLDYLCSDERLLHAFAAETGHDPAQIEVTRRSLVPNFDDETG